MTKVDRRTTAEESQSHEHDADDRWNCQAHLVDDVFLHSSTKSFIDKIPDLAPQRLRQLRNVLSGESCLLNFWPVDSVRLCSGPTCDHVLLDSLYFQQSPDVSFSGVRIHACLVALVASAPSQEDELVGCFQDVRLLGKQSNS